MKTDLASSREFIARRGHMVAFLLGALAVSMVMNNTFADEINQGVAAELGITLESSM